MRSDGVCGYGTALIVRQPREATPTQLNDRRVGQRFSTAQQVEFCIPNQITPAELVNLSDGGARLRIARGVIAAMGGRVAIRLLDETILLGVTRWVNSQDIGVQFMGTTINAEDHLYYDDAGQHLFSMILQQQRRLSQL